MDKPSLVGRKFSRLLVIAPDKAKHGRSQWRCQCDCGMFCIASGKALRTGKKHSCGCFRRDRARAHAAILSFNNRLEPGEAGFNLLYATYRCGAEHRGLLFEISKEDFKQLTKKDCSYCGAHPNQKIGNDVTGRYTYNGLDRVDNSIGYRVENCVACCGRCNRMKHAMTAREFMDACLAVSSHQENCKKSAEMTDSIGQSRLAS